MFLHYREVLQDYLILKVLQKEICGFCEVFYLLFYKHDYFWNYSFFHWKPKPVDQVTSKDSLSLTVYNTDMSLGQFVYEMRNTWTN